MSCNEDPTKNNMKHDTSSATNDPDIKNMNTVHQRDDSRGYRRSITEVDPAMMPAATQVDMYHPTGNRCKVLAPDCTNA